MALRAGLQHWRLLDVALQVECCLKPTKLTVCMAVMWADARVYILNSFMQRWTHAQELLTIAWDLTPNAPA